MDIFKLFFNHDQRLDKTVERDAKAALQDFMTPTPTFSKFYLAGTRLKENEFGLNCLTKYPQIIEKLDNIWGEFQFHTPDSSFSGIEDAVKETAVGRPILLSKNVEFTEDLTALIVDDDSNLGHIKDDLRHPLMQGFMILYKEKAGNGFDLHLFSKENIYGQLFYPFRELVDDSFRFFSINSKRMHSERHFYFETWTLDRPPHGAEEVFTDTEF